MPVQFEHYSIGEALIIMLRSSRIMDYIQYKVNIAANLVQRVI